MKIWYGIKTILVGQRPLDVNHMVHCAHAQLYIPSAALLQMRTPPTIHQKHIFFLITARRSLYILFSQSGDDGVASCASIRPDYK
jgi:hypothetical protein